MRRRIIIVSLAFHVALVFSLFAVGVWDLERVEAGRLTVAIGTPLPPPPAPAGGAAPTKAPTFTHKVIVHGIVIPDPKRTETATKPAEVPGNGSGDGSGSGQGSGSAADTGPCTENCGPGDGSGSAVVETKKKTDETVLVPPTVLRGMRIAGETQIHPSDTVKTAMLHEGHARSTAVFKVCVGAGGEVGSVSMMKSSGYGEYDQALVAALRGWRYKAYEIGGQAVPVCGIVTFVYEIK